MMCWIFRIFGGSVIRRIAALFVFAVLAAMAAKVSAQTVPSSLACAPADKCYQGEAYSVCMATASQARARALAVNPSNNITGTACALIPSDGQGPFYRCQLIVPGSWTSCGTYVSKFDYHFDDRRTCTANNTAFPPGDMQPSTAQRPSTCYGGCKIQGTEVSSSTGGITIYGMIDRTYTGEVCSKQNDSNAPILPPQEETKNETAKKEPECNALGGGQTACMKPNGDNCATASTGKTFCWKPTEVGKKIDGQDAQVKGKKGEPVTPPDVKIEDKDWQRKEGHQQTACVNSTCTTYNVTNFQTAPSGSAKNSTGDNNADGSGNTSGNGTPGKPSSGKDGDGDNGEGDSASDSGNCDTPPACTGDTLKCLHLRYTWKVECNTRGSEITKGDGCGENDIPICAGKSCKSEAYASVLQQWKQRCAMQAMGEGMARRKGNINNGDDAGVVEGIWGGESGGTGLKLRQDLISVGGGGGSLLPDVEIEGQRWNIPPGFYDAIAAIKMVIIAMCTVIAMFVVGRNI